MRAVPVGPACVTPRILMMLGWIRLDKISFSNDRSLLSYEDEGRRYHSKMGCSMGCKMKDFN